MRRSCRSRSALRPSAQRPAPAPAEVAVPAPPPAPPAAPSARAVTDRCFTSRPRSPGYDSHAKGYG